MNVRMNTYNSISNSGRELIAQTVNGARNGADKNINSEEIVRHYMGVEGTGKNNKLYLCYRKE